MEKTMHASVLSITWLMAADSDLKSANIGIHSANIGGRKFRINRHQPSDTQAHAEQWCE